MRKDDARKLDHATLEAMRERARLAARVPNTRRNIGAISNRGLVAYPPIDYSKLDPNDPLDEALLKWRHLFDPQDPQG
jgi:hypothetical protein